jgi:flavodoxin
MKEILIVYFSRSGYTQRVAQEVAHATGADSEAIRERKSRRGFMGYWRSAREALRAVAAHIEPDTSNPCDYSLVVLGTPVWAGHVSSPVRAYIARHKDDFARVALFCTEGGSGAPKVLQAMSALCGRTPVATAFFTDAEIDRGRHTDKLEAFARALSQQKD